jgi:rubrerythrin
MEGKRKVGKDLTSLEVLGVAIRSEVDSQTLYRKLAQRVKNDLVKQKFKTLVKDEKGHEVLLSRMYQRLTGEKNVPMPGQWAGKFRYDPEMSDAEAVRLAIRMERAASKLYAGAAKKTKDLNGRFMLEYLAGFERNHERLLEQELTALTKYPAWFENENGADIMLIGP